jgi:hypothetical protein
LGVEVSAGTYTIIHDWNELPTDGVCNDTEVDLVVSYSPLQIRFEPKVVLTSKQVQDIFNPLSRLGLPSESDPTRSKDYTIIFFSVEIEPYYLHHYAGPF